MTAVSPDALVETAAPTASTPAAQPKALSPYKQRFVDSYIENWHGPTAARAAGYSDSRAERQAQALLKDEEVLAAIVRECQAQGMETIEAVMRLSNWGRGTLEPFLRRTPEDGLYIDLSTEEARANYHLLKRVKQTRTVTETEQGPVVTIETEIELHDAMDACYKLLLYHGVIPPMRVEHVGAPAPEVAPEAAPVKPRREPSPDYTEHINKRYRRNG